MKMDDLIRDNDFCEIITDKFEAEGVKKGTRVYIAGHKAIPEDANDPYTQRVKFFVHLVHNSIVIYEKGLFLMDPRSLRKVKKREQKKLMDKLEAQLVAAEAQMEAEANAAID